LIDQVNHNDHMADFFLTVPPNGAINYYFDSAIENSILSVQYEIRGISRKVGKCVNLLCNFNIFML